MYSYLAQTKGGICEHLRKYYVGWNKRDSGSIRLRWMEQVGLWLNLTKCHFMAMRVEFLGYKTDGHQLHPCFQEKSKLSSKHQNSGMSQNRKHIWISWRIKAVSFLTFPLFHSSLQVVQEWGTLAVELEWTKHVHSFEALTCVSRRTGLLWSQTRAGSRQWRIHIWHWISIIPQDSQCREADHVCFKDLATNREKYNSLVAKEALACLFAIKRFHSYIYGVQFTLHMNHTWFFTLAKKKKKLSSVTPSFCMDSTLGTSVIHV